MRVIKKTRRVTGSILNIEDWEIAFPGGNATYQLVLHNGAAAIIAVDDQGRTPMVRQARAGANCTELLEVPAGKLDGPDEAPLCCAQRELEEETGLRAACWQPLGHTYTSPAYCTERIALFLATELSPGKQHLDDDEFLSVEWYPLAELGAMALRGDIADMKSALCILLACGKLGITMLP